MFLVSTLDLHHHDAISEISDSIHTSIGWQLADDRASGYLQTKEVGATLAYKWEGIETFQEQGIAIALAKNVDDVPQFYEFTNNNWVETASPIFYSLPILRGYFTRWSGQCVFRIQLTRLPDGRSPTLNQFRVGYHALGNILDHLIQFKLPELFRIPVEVSRTVKLSGRKIPVPDQFDPTRLIAPQVMFVPSQVNHELAIVGQDFQLDLAVTVPPNQIGILHFYQQLAVTPISEILAQIDDLPCLLIRQPEIINTRNLYVERYVRVSDTEVAVSMPRKVFDVKLELIVYTDRLADARAIGDRIIERICDNGVIDLPAFEYPVRLTAIGGVKTGNAPSTPAAGRLYTASISLVLGNILGGFTEYRRAAIDTINIISALV